MLHGRHICAEKDHASVHDPQGAQLVKQIRETCAKTVKCADGISPSPSLSILSIRSHDTNKQGSALSPSYLLHGMHQIYVRRMSEWQWPVGPVWIGQVSHEVQVGSIEYISITLAHHHLPVERRHMLHVCAEYADSAIVDHMLPHADQSMQTWTRALWTTDNFRSSNTQAHVAPHVFI